MKNKKTLVSNISQIFVCDNIDIELSDVVEESIYNYYKTKPIFNYMNPMFSNISEILRDGYEVSYNNS